MIQNLLVSRRSQIIWDQTRSSQIICRTAGSGYCTFRRLSRSDPSAAASPWVPGRRCRRCCRWCCTHTLTMENTATMQTAINL